MKTLNITISDKEYEKFGFNKNQLAFNELIELVQREFSRQLLSQSIELSEKYGLSSMTMDEITKEVQTARKIEKGNT